jgi:limonene-1,2-epoxide hydrolase
MSSRAQFDPERSWKPLVDRIESEEDPRCRQLLEQVRDHLRTEIRGEFDALMATLADEPRYHLWGVGPEMGPKGRDAVAAFYTDMIASGGNHFEFEIRRIVVDHDAVVTEGVMRTLMPGALVAASGISEVAGAPVDADARYVSENQILTVWPAAEDGRIKGEDIYFGSPPLSSLALLAE